MNIIFFYTYYFYSKITKEEDPLFEAAWAIGIAFAFFIGFYLDAIFIYFFCIEINITLSLLQSIFWFALSHYYYVFLGNGVKIVNGKPKFIFNKKISIFLTVMYYIFGISSMFLGPMLSHFFINTYCK